MIWHTDRRDKVVKDLQRTSSEFYSTCRSFLQAPKLSNISFCFTKQSLNAFNASDAKRGYSRLGILCNSLKALRKMKADSNLTVEMLISISKYNGILVSIYFIYR